MSSQENKRESPPTAFISYSHDNEEHKRWVRQLAAHLRLNGIDAKLDYWEAPLGADFGRFMEQLPNCDFALPICTPKYCEKSQSGQPSGVKWEAQLISASMYENISGGNGVRVIPIIRESTPSDVLPKHFRMLNSIDFSDDRKYEIELERLVISLHGLEESAGKVLEAPKDVNGKLVLRLKGQNQVESQAGKSADSDNGIQKPKVTPWAEGGTSKRSYSYGIILVADVVNSSSLKGQRLQWALDKMSEYARGNAIGSATTGLILHCLLDSFIVVLPDCDAYREVLEFASEWVRHMQSPPFALDIRVAVHFGTYFVSDSLKMVVGAGPNECSRLVRLAGEKQVLVSEQFINEVRRQPNFDNVDPKLFTPNPLTKKDPLEIQMKQGQLSQVRIYETGLNSKLPFQLQQIEDADRAIWKTLEKIDNFFIELVKQRTTNFNHRSVKQRLSIFAPNHDMSYLVCTEFRRFGGRSRSSANNLKARGSTRYSIDANLPVGPLGVAYHRKKPVAVNSLPDYKIDPNTYERKLKMKPYFIDEKTIANFGRHARCFLSIPFSFSDQVECLVCIDTEDPLELFTKRELEDIGRWIQVVFELTLASLWRLRT